MKKSPLVSLRWLFLVLVASLLLLVSGSALGGIEYNTDRGGQDYRSFDLGSANPSLCPSACAREGRCKAWTYVKPGYQGKSARCRVKHSVPRASSNNCCVSGVKGRTGPAMGSSGTPSHGGGWSRVPIAPARITGASICPVQTPACVERPAVKSHAARHGLTSSRVTRERAPVAG